MGSVTSPYWIYLVYGLGAVGLWTIGKRKWYGWLIMVPVRLATAFTAYLTATSWAVLGSITYFLVDIYCLFDWRRRQRIEQEAAARFVNMITKQYVDGKRAAIDELIQISRDVDELTGTKSPEREDDLLRTYLHRVEAEQAEQEAEQEHRSDS